MSAEYERNLNRGLTDWLWSRGFEIPNFPPEGDPEFSIECHDNELIFYVSFKGDYSYHACDSRPLFTRSLDSIALLVGVMRVEEKDCYRDFLVRKMGRGLGREAIDSKPMQRAEAAACMIEKMREIQK